MSSVFRSFAVSALFVCLSVGAAGCGGHHASSVLPRNASSAARHTKTIAEAAYPNAVLADAPIAYYRLDDTSATMADSSPNHLDGTYGTSVVRGKPSLVATNADAAAGFPGGSYSAAGIATVPQSTTFQQQPNVTVEALINETSAPGSIVELITYGPSGGQPWSLRVSASNAITARVHTTTGTFDVTGPTITPGTTYHVAMTYDGSAERLYVNGALAATTTCTGSIDYSSVGTSGLGIGGAQNSTRTVAFSGTIDDVAVYGAGLSSARVGAHYGASTNIPTSTADPYAYAVTSDSPTAYYRLDDPGSLMADATSNHLNGTYGTSVVHGKPSLLATNADAAAGFPGGSYSAAGIATVPQSTTFQQQPNVTVEALINETSAPGSIVELITYGPSGGQPWSLRISASNAITARVHTTTGTFDVTGPTITPGTTYHVAMTYDGSAERLYVNGALAATTACTGSIDYSSVGTSGLGIGGAQNSTRTVAFSGTIDEVAVYGAALSAARVNAHYTAANISGTIVWQTGAGTLGQYQLPTPSDGQCDGVGPVISGSNASFTVLRNTNGTYSYDGGNYSGSSTCWRNQMNPIDPNTGTNFLLGIGAHYTFAFQTVLTLNGNSLYQGAADGGLAVDIPAIVWQTHTYGGDGEPCDLLVIQNTYKAYIDGYTQYGTVAQGGQPTWNFHTCDENDFTGNAYNSADTLHDGEVDNWQIDITAQIQGQNGGSVAVRRNGTVVYNAASHVCDSSTTECFWNFGPYMFYFGSSEEPPTWNNAGVTVQVNNMTLYKQ